MVEDGVPSEKPEDQEPPPRGEAEVDKNTTDELEDVREAFSNYTCMINVKRTLKIAIMYLPANMLTKNY